MRPSEPSNPPADPPANVLPTPLLTPTMGESTPKGDTLPAGLEFDRSRQPTGRKERFRLKSVLGEHSDHERPRLRALLAQHLDRRSVDDGTDSGSLAHRQQKARATVQKALADRMFPVQQRAAEQRQEG